MTTTSDNFLPIVKQAHIIQRLYSTPLVSEFGASIPIKHPGGKIFFLSRKPEKKYDNSNPQENVVIQNQWGSAPEGTKVSSYKFDILSRTVEMKTQKIKSAWTIEALQDYKVLFVEKNEDEISKTLAGELTNEAIFQLDNDFVTQCSKEAKKYKVDFAQYNNTSKYDLCFNLIEKIYNLAADMIMRLHNKSAISVLVSPSICSVLMSHPHFKPHEKLDGTIDEDNLFFVGSIHNIKLFNDYYGFLDNIQENKDTSASMLIGVKDLHNEVNSSVIFNPYQASVVTENDTNTGEYGMFVFFSYGITLSPQHSFDTPMLKFVEFTNATTKDLQVSPSRVELTMGDQSEALTIANYGADFEFSVADTKIATFDKGTKKITAKGVEGTTILTIKGNGQSQNVEIVVSKPQIKIS